MKTRHYIVLILAMVLTTACEDYLDRPPLDAIENDSYWKSAVDLQNYTAQYYEDFPGHNNNRYTEVGYPNDDHTSRSSSNLLNGLTTINTGTWQSDFAPIRSVNIFFENYRRCEEPFQTYQQYLGEAQFFKAWFYFNAVKRYGDVPWYTNALTPDQEAELQRPRDPRTMVVDSILSLLDKAVQNVSLRDEAAWGNNSVNKEAVLAFISRVALYEATWQKYHKDTPFGTPGTDPNTYFQASVAAAEELINGAYNVGIYNNGNPESDYFILHGLGDMGPVNEVLLYRAYNSGQRISHNQNFYTINSPNENGATWSYATSFLANDGTPFDYNTLAQTSQGSDFLADVGANVDSRFKQSIFVPGQLMSTITGQVFDKAPIFGVGLGNSPTGFQFRKGSTIDKVQGYSTAHDAGYIIFSYAEVLLNYAEAKYELDGSVATEQLNLLRARVGMPEFTVNQQSNDTNLKDYGYPISDELYEIRRERHVELAFQQVRSDDWHRWAAHNLFAGKRPFGYPFNQSEFPDQSPLLNADGLLDVLQDDIPNGYGFRPGQDYLSSVPETELTLNPNLTQNPGW